MNINRIFDLNETRNACGSCIDQISKDNGNNDDESLFSWLLQGMSASIQDQREAHNTVFDTIGFPKDAFEPVPLRPDRAFGPSIDSLLLEAILDQTLDVDVKVSSTSVFCHLEESEKLPSQETNYGFPADIWHCVPNDSYHKKLISVPTSSALTASRKRSNSQPNFTETVTPTPKRRRTSSIEEEPSFRRHQEKQWIEQFNELIKFKELHGHCLVPHTYPKNQVLSRWVKRQRYQYKLKQRGKVSTMTDARIHKLENVGFVWDSHAITWSKRFQELWQYREEHGNCNVPSNYPKNQELAVWVKCQRRQHKLFWSSNKSSSMTLDRMRVLNELGFQWKVREDDYSMMLNQNDF